MESLFEPSSYLDPTPYDPSSFLTFSSFANLTASPPSISDTWDDVFFSASSSSSYSSSSFSPSPLSSKQAVAPPLISTFRTAYSASSDCSTPDLSSDPFEISYSAFEASIPGIFHTPSKSGNAKLSAADAAAPGLTHRVTSSTDSNWDSPIITPSLNGPGFASPAIPSKGAFSWDDAPATLASSSYTPPTTAVSPVPLRVASNPSLGAHKNPRAIRPVNSMPALKEEVDTFQWFDGSSLLDTEPVTDEALVDNFDWVFGDFGLGESLPIEGTIFAAFRENEQDQPVNTPTPITSASASTSAPLPSESTFTSTIASASPTEPTDNQYNNNTTWYNPNEATQAVNQSMPTFEYNQMYTIDPLVLGGSADGVSRPSSAPGAEGGESSAMLSAPMLGQMSRSHTAPGYVPTQAMPTEVYTYPAPPTHYAPSQYAPQTQQQSPYVSAQGLPMRSLPQRRASHGLTISVNAPNFSTYTPATDLPNPPHSAPFSSSSMMHHQAHAQSAYSPQVFSHLQAPVAMARAGTQPLPVRRGSTSGHSASASTSSMPAHLVRAQAIVQMQEAKEEAKRQEMRRQAAARRVGMAEASVMQPLTSSMPYQPPPNFAPHQPRSQPSITGWGGPSSLPSQSNMPSGMGGALGPALTTQPLIVHPPPSYYSAAPPHTYHPQPQPVHTQQPQPPQHRIHPPPHPGMGPGVGLGMAIPRPMARLPSSPTKRRVTSPAKRSPSGSATKARRAPMQPGGFSWGEATFINFTPDDAEKLLTGVAPSGSQAKRKREEDLARGVTGMSMGTAGGLLASAEFVAVDMDREGSKRSRSGE